MIITLAELTTLLNALVTTHILRTDHIFVSKSLLDNLAKVPVLNCGNNMSDHCILGFKKNSIHVVKRFPDLIFCSSLKCLVLKPITCGPSMDSLALVIFSETKTKYHIKYVKASKLSKMREKGIFMGNLLEALLSKTTSNFWCPWWSKTNSNNASSSNLTADYISEKFKANFIDSAGKNVSVANFLHKLRSIKYEQFDSGIDVECLKNCLSQLNNSFCLDAQGLSKCLCS